MLKSINLIDRHHLPTLPGIYIIRGKDKTCLYVGQSTNLRKRWRGDRHHRYPQAVTHEACLEYFLCQESELDDTEKQMIRLLRPLWNYTTSDYPGETYPLGKQHWETYQSMLESPMELIQENLSARAAIILLREVGALNDTTAQSVNLRVTLEEQGYYLIEGRFLKYLIKHRSCCLQRRENMSRLFELS